MGIIATNEAQDEVFETERDELLHLLESTTFEETQRSWIRVSISSLTTKDELEQIRQKLYANQVGIDGIVNPSQRDIKRHINSLR